MPAAVPIIVSLAGTYAGHYLAVTAGYGFIGYIIGAGVTYALTYTAQEMGIWPVPETPQINAIESAKGAVINKTGADAPLPVVYGLRRSGGIIVFMRVDPADSDYLNVILAHSEGNVGNISEHEYDNRVFTAPEVQISVSYGSTTQTVNTTVQGWLGAGVWTDNHRLRGVAYCAYRIKWSPNNWPRGRPQITSNVLGRYIYDGRPSIPTYSSSRNPAIILRDYLTNTTYGRAIPSEMIDTDSFEAAADYCDEDIEIPEIGEPTRADIARWQCDAVIDTSAEGMSNVNAILATCRGMLVYSGGMYRLVLDKPESTAVHTFDESNIVGEWSIRPPGKGSVLNRVRARFINPYNNWKADYVVADAPTLRADEDNGRLLEQELQLPFVTNIYRAYILAAQTLNQSRYSLAVDFTAQPDGLLAQVGDVVEITHPTPGWVRKMFRVSTMVLEPGGLVRVTAVEYNDAVYDDSVIELYEGSDADPDDLVPAVPVNLSATDELYQTREGGIVMSRVSLTWDDPDDPFIIHYESEVSTDGGSSWSGIGISGSSPVHVEVDPGLYSFRVRSVNTLGLVSEWAVVSVQVTGISAPPALPSNFAVTMNDNLTATASWDELTELDVVYGGHIEIRAASPASPNWGEGHTVVDLIPGTASHALVSHAGAGGHTRFMLKVFDQGGNESSGVASATLSVGTIGSWTTHGLEPAHPLFTGAKTNMSVDANKLHLTPGQTSGTYEFNTKFTHASALSTWLRILLVSDVVSLGTLIDDRSQPIDLWPDIDEGSGAAGGQGSIRMLMRTSLNDVDWSEWVYFNEAVIAHCKYMQAKIEVDVESSDYDIEISALIAQTLTE